MSLKLTLYYASWCGHCHTFMPEWELLETCVDEVNNKYGDIDITMEKYEEKDKELQKNGGGKINNTGIEGYPTVKIGLKKGNDEKEYDLMKYVNKRDYKTICIFIKEVAKLLQEY